MESSSWLQAELDKNQKTEINIKYNFAKNHVGMTLIALDKMGKVAGIGVENEPAQLKAVEKDIAAVVKHYTTVVIPALDNKEVTFGKPQDLDAVVTAENFESMKGDLANATAFARHLYEVTKELLSSNEGNHTKVIDALLTKYFPPLFPGIHGGAFHALLRISYGMDAGDAFEVASGLSYMASSLDPFRADAPMASTNDSSRTSCVADTIKKSVSDVIAAAPTLQVDVTNSPSIAARQKAFFANNAFTVLVPRFQEGTDILAALSTMRQASLAAFEQYQDFSVLHAVTSCCAMATVAQYLTPDALTTYWSAVLATLACTVMLASAPNAKLKGPLGAVMAADKDATNSWPSLSRRMFETLRERSETEDMAIFNNSHLEHLVKLAYTSQQDAQRDAELTDRLLAVVRREVTAFSQYY